MKRRILALLLVFAMVFGVMPAIAIGVDDDSPVETTPIESTPIESTPVESTPVESTPVESTPAESTPVESTPAESTPVESTPVESTPVESTPVESTPVESTPVESTPVESTPAESTPVESTPVESTPVESTPVESTPVESTPVESTPAESTPVESTPIESTPAEITPEETVDVEALLDRIAACQSEQEFWALLNSLTDAEWAAVEALAQSEEEADELHAFAEGECPESEPPFAAKTVNFTDAGPLMPPVVVEIAKKPVLRMMVAASPLLGVSSVSSPEPDNGLILNKTAEQDGDRYKITLEAYTTGTVVTTTTMVPVDIVLVLDQSGSMTYDFDGDNANYEDSRQYAMQNAVKAFIESVADRYSTDADHRMALVTYGSDATVLRGWTTVNAAGETALENNIDGLSHSPSGSTNIAAGMADAQDLMGTGYNYTGSNTSRQKVVIVFTDGVPTTGSTFNTTVATNAIADAKALKDSGVSIYTIGVFNGANVTQLYGASGFDTNSDGTVGSYWESRWGLFSGGDLDAAEIPAGNRFLNYLSSNFEDAEQIGLTRSTRSAWLGAVQYVKFTITQDYTRDTSGYYLTAGDESALNSIFTSISEQIGTPNIELGASTVMKDLISPYFALDGSVDTYTADKTASGWAARTAYAEANVHVSGREVTVSGFNFNDNFVSNTHKEDGTYGKKLIVEFYVIPETGFLGGNGVPTNEGSSGIYSGGSLVEAFEVPTVDVPVTYAVSADDSVVCIGTDADVDELFTFTALNGTNNAYVDITFTKPDGSTYTADAGSSLSSLALAAGSALTTCTDYTLSADVIPVDDSLDGTAPVTSTYADTATVHVLKPTITWSDRTVDMGTEADLADSFVSITWADVDAAHTGVSTAAAVAWTVDYAYATAGNPVSSGTYTVNSDTGFDVSVTVNGTDVTQHVCFVRTNDGNCSHSDTHSGSVDNVEFVLHVSSFDLTITKTIAGGVNPTQSFIFDITNDSGFSMSVVLTPDDFMNGSASITVYGLSSGSYTVTERGNWSWKYALSSTNGVNVNCSDRTAPFTNMHLTDIYWLGDAACAPNIFNKEEGGAE